MLLFYAMLLQYLRMKHLFEGNTMLKLLIRVFFSDSNLVKMHYANKITLKYLISIMYK